MRIDGRTRVCGLMGYPVEHTLSPLIHNMLAEDLGHHLLYVPFSVEPDRVGEAVKGARALNLMGLNVTVPHKSAVIPWLVEVDELAEKIGAVNTLVRCGDGYKGYNTDMTGLQSAMRTDGIELSGESVVVLGAGGAARAVAFLCAHAGAREVWLLNRTPERAVQIAREVNDAFGRDCVHGLALAAHEKIPKGQYLAVQGTSGYDLIYKPRDTRFMQLVRAHGGKAYNGLKMLAYQAVHAYELWNGVKVDEAETNRIIQILREETNVI